MNTNIDQINKSLLNDNKDIKEGFSISKLIVNSTGFYTNRLGKSQPPILVVTPDGEFQWHEDAGSRIDLDDFDGYESLRHILITLWKATNKNV